ncbi:MAG TPA: hypothetical protein PKB10_14085, partial [Tepidisphaeraceae bacterium]|nr:hypothetical protein [Tepidisphaeraceae bacterium]
MLIDVLRLLLQTDNASPPRDDTTIYIALGTALVVMAWLTLRPRRRKDPLDRPPGFASLSQQRAVEREMTNLLVELEKMARQMNAQLDTRAAKLEALLQDADNRIAELQRLQGQPVNTPVESADRPALRLVPPEPNNQPPPTASPNRREDDHGQHDDNVLHDEKAKCDLAMQRIDLALVREQL